MLTGNLLTCLQRYTDAENKNKNMKTQQSATIHVQAPCPGALFNTHRDAYHRDTQVIQHHGMHNGATRKN